MIDFDEFLRTVIDGARDIAWEFLQQGVEEAGQDAEAFLQGAREKLERWTRLLAAGDLTRDEFAFLVRSQADLAELFALTRLGIGLARLQEFRTKLVDLVIDRAFRLIPI